MDIDTGRIFRLHRIEQFFGNVGNAGYTAWKFNYPNIKDKRMDLTAQGLLIEIREEE